MKLLLTSAGVKNKSIHDALAGLLGKPVAESTALCIPTSTYALPGGGGHAYRFITGQGPTPLCELGWKSLGVPELTALPSIDEELWVSQVRETDALLVAGGDALYLAYWMRQSGLADLFALGLVDFAMFPHLDHQDLPTNSMAGAEKWAASVPVPGYAIDDQTAIKVVDGDVEVVTEGHWRLFTP
jgi:dipeptidase E